MDTAKIAKEIIIEKIEEKLNKYPLLMETNDIKEVLGIRNKPQLYDMLGKGQIPGAQKIPGMGWRINRDVFFTWLYSGETGESKPFKSVRRLE